MLIKEQKALAFKDVMIQPCFSNINSRVDVSLERTFKFKYSSKTWTGVPIIAANMDTVGLIEYALKLQEHKILTALHKFYPIHEIEQAIDNGLNPKYITLTTGIREADFERLETFKLSKIKDVVDIIMIDVPNGYIPAFFDSCKRIREMFPDHILMAGNVVTGDVTKYLLDKCGIDVVKVGIGGGAKCLTTNKTGVGKPQLQTVLDTVDDATTSGGFVISDGGHSEPSDVAKSLSAGAGFVMIGTMFAAHTEDTSSESILKDGHKHIKVYGMSSWEAMTKYYKNTTFDYKTSEGTVRHIQCKGPIDSTVADILGGLRSTCTYIGAASIEEMHKKTTFIVKH